MYGYHMSVCLQTGLFVSDGYVFYNLCFTHNNRFMYGYHLSVCPSVYKLFASDGYVFCVICFTHTNRFMYGYHLSVSMSTRTGLFASDGYAFHVICVSRIRIGLYMVISHQFFLYVTSC